MEIKDGNKNQLQQGDVIFELIGMDALPKGAVKKAADGRIVIAEGEETGHAHAISAKQTQNCQMYVVKKKESNLSGVTAETLFLEVFPGKEVTVCHEEHDEIKLGPGVWATDQIFEHDHVANLTKKVVD